MQLELITRQPASNPRPTPLLFVHGAWHGAWCWAEYFLPYFAQHGYVSHALSLRGHGTSEGNTRWNLISDYVEDVKQVAQGLAASPVIIGHSMGGFTAQKYLETNPAPAAVLLASIPSFGMLVKAYFARMQDESWGIVVSASFLQLPHPQKVTTPMLVLGAENDTIFPVNEVQATARAYRTTAEIFPNMAHDMMLEAGWQSVADRIIAWLREKN
ncbi:MAG: alpha/beta fold hydrolase [Chloroflexi bacterium]|nr:alpha/beta fold hydrolase [Chloroflexota bacterium]